MWTIALRTPASMAANVWTELVPFSASALQDSPANDARVTSTSAFPNHVLALALQTVCNCSMTTSAIANQAGVDVSARSGSTSVPPIPVPMAGHVPSLNRDTSAPAPRASLDLIAASTVEGSAPQHLVVMAAPAWQILTAKLVTDANVPPAQMDQNARLILSTSVAFIILVVATDGVRTRLVDMSASVRSNTEDGTAKYST